MRAAAITRLISALIRVSPRPIAALIRVYPRSIALRAGAAAVVLAVVPAAAAGQTSPAAPFIGRTVASVRIEIEGRETTEAALAELVETRPGAPLSMQQVRETVAHLFSLGRFEDVEVHADDADPRPGAGPSDAVVLRFNLIPVHGVERIDFRGELGLDEGQLRRLIADRFGATPPAGRADAAARALEQLYADRGYLRARVTQRLDVQHDPDRTTLVFAVESGPRARVGSVNVDGDPVMPVAEVLDDLDLAPGAVYDPFELERRIDAYEQKLHHRRYYEARVSHGRRARENDAVVDVTVTIDRGPLVSVTIEGDPLPKERIDDLVPIEREGSADRDLLEDSERRIEAFLHGEGYWKAEASADSVERGDELLIVFLVNRGARYVVDTIEITGNASVPIEKLRPLVRLERGEPFVEAALNADVAAMTQHYRQQGFTAAKVAPAVSETGDTPAAGVGRVAVRIAITEGPRTSVGAIRIEGNRAVAEGELRAVMAVKPGAPFYEPPVAADREAVLLAYLNRGHQQATVSVDPVESGSSRTEPTGVSRTVDLVYRVSEGPVILVDHILVVGNRRTSEQTIRNELLVRSGGPLGLADLIESRRRLSALGLFRRVRITEVGHGREDRRDLIITVEEAEPTTLGVGAGFEVGLRTVIGDDGLAEERIELAPRGFFEIGRRNLGGRNRSINLSTRVSFRKRGESIARPDEPGFGFNEYRVALTYREPRAFGWDVDTAVTAFAEQGIRTAFNFSRRAINVDLLRRLTPILRANARYSFGRTKLFDERIPPEQALNIDRLFPQVRLSSGVGSLFRDTRDDVLDPARGMFLGLDGEVAARAVGSQVGYAKTFVQVLLFRPVVGSPRVIVAGGVRVGLATGFPRELTTVDGRSITVRELPASERFFAGGSTTVRGFANDKLGARETISEQGFPIGGNALIVLNAELRAPIWKDLGGVVFFDAGNVFARASDVELASVRSSVGFGLRYGSPIGPIRVDLGFKLRKRQLAPGQFEGRTAFHISIGQAF